MNSVFKVMYETPGQDVLTEYLTYGSPKNEYDTEAAAVDQIMAIRDLPGNKKRDFIVMEVQTTEWVRTIVAAVEPPDTKPELDFTVIDKRDMGIQGVV